jgi:ATP-dependent DNA helicase PIF1
MRSNSLPKNNSKYRYDDDDGQNGQNKENIINQHHQRQDRDSQKSLLDESNSGRSDGRPSLTSMQNKVIQACLSGKNVFCTGGAGTGKTTLLLALIDALIEMHGKSSVFITATTGLAACAIGGKTVHQFAGIKTSIEEHDDNLSLLKPQQLDRVVKQACSTHNVLKRYRDAKVLLVDEVSMLSPTLLEVGNQST